MTINYKVKYFGGIQATSKILTLRIEEDRLYFYPNEHSVDPIKSWPINDLFFDENFNMVCVIGCRTEKGKIEVLEKSQVDSLLKECKLTKNHIVQFSSSQLITWIGSIALIALTIWLSMPAISKLIVNQISFENEVKLSKHIPLDQHFKMCSLSNEQTKALENFRNFLYPKNPNEINMPLEIKVAELDQVNAFTFPGGTIILLSGLINDAKTPEELLSILAHEMGHVVARDNFNFLVRSSIITSFFAYLTGDFSSAAIINPQTMMSIMALSYDREMEMNADRFAINRLISLGVSQKGMYDFFMRRKNEATEKIPEMILTHPNFENRLKNINPAMGKTHMSSPLQDDFKIIKGICN